MKSVNFVSIASALILAFVGAIALLNPPVFAQTSASPGAKITPKEIIQQYGPPDEIIERGLMKETVYRYAQMTVLFKNGYVVNPQKIGVAASGAADVPHVRTIRAGQRAEVASPKLVGSILRDLSKESADPKSGGTPGAAEPPPFNNPDAASDF